MPTIQQRSRILLEDASRVRPVGVSVTDPLGARLLREWIASLDGCPE